METQERENFKELEIWIHQQERECKLKEMEIPSGKRRAEKKLEIGQRERLKDVEMKELEIQGQIIRREQEKEQSEIANPRQYFF